MARQERCESSGRKRDSRFSRSPLTLGCEVIGSPNAMPELFAASEPAQIIPTSLPDYGRSISDAVNCKRRRGTHGVKGLNELLDPFVLAESFSTFRSSRNNLSASSASKPGE